VHAISSAVVSPRFVVVSPPPERGDIVDRISRRINPMATVKLYQFQMYD
jgi:hypothetical protein